MPAKSDELLVHDTHFVYVKSPSLYGTIYRRLDAYEGLMHRGEHLGVLLKHPLLHAILLGNVTYVKESLVL